MIARIYLEANLRRLDRLYRDARTTKDALFFSKLAVLELCGWIEESMDDVVLRCSMRCLRDPSNRRQVKDSVVKKTYGFEYHKHFREMLTRLIGLVEVEKLERRLDATKHARLKSTLGSLAGARNAEAHTHLKGVTRVINAPSVTIGHFSDVYDGLVEYDTALRRLL
jgi:hypothetical protein